MLKLNWNWNKPHPALSCRSCKQLPKTLWTRPTSALHKQGTHSEALQFTWCINTELRALQGSGKKSWEKILKHEEWCSRSSQDPTAGMGNSLTTAHSPFSFSVKWSKHAPRMSQCYWSPNPLAGGSPLLPAQPFLWPKHTFRTLKAPCAGTGFLHFTHGAEAVLGYRDVLRGEQGIAGDLWTSPCTATPFSKMIFHLSFPASPAPSP